MHELRLNLISREWVVVGSGSPRKPEDFRNKGERHLVPEHMDFCPFCTGNESKTPVELHRVPAEGPWRIRVTPNKFPTLIFEGERERINHGVKRQVSGVGRHEVIIESPRHNAMLALMSTDEVREILRVYRSRFNEAFRDRRIQHVIIFKNHGPGSGTTLDHSHSQLIGVPVMPLQVRYRVDESMRYFDNVGECIICDTLRDELKDEERIVVETEHFLAFVPYAALSPFHLWIFPKKHIASFGSTSDEELEGLAQNLRLTLGKLYEGLDNPSFNMVVRSLSPFRSRSEYIHWYISIFARVTPTTGFELGSGMYVNQSMPEEVAAYLRGIKVS